MRALCAVTPLSAQTRNTTRAAALRVNRRGARQVEEPAFGSTKFKYSEGQERETSSLCTLAPVTELPKASRRFYTSAEGEGFRAGALQWPVPETLALLWGRGALSGAEAAAGKAAPAAGLGQSRPWAGTQMFGGLWGAAVPAPLLRAGGAALCAVGNCCVLLPCGQRGHWRRTPTAVLLG